MVGEVVRGVFYIVCRRFISMVCYRIRWKDLVVVECEGKRVSKSRVKFPEAMKIVELFRKHGNLGLIRDGNFLFGGLCVDAQADVGAKRGRTTGKRIRVLPNGVELNKGFSLFASKLTIHDEKSRGHWDVIFENASGSFSYLYSLDKMQMSREKKFGLVDRFEKCLPRLRRNLLKEISRDKEKGVRDKGDLVLAMLVLLKTRMRVGGEIYYKRSRHKGLTTLKKKDIRIVGNVVSFDFVGKDGVPQELKERFDERVVGELRRVLRKRKRNDFVFLASARHDSGKPKGKGRILKDTDFEAGFERFCGERFYPHIVRSHFATREVEKFLERNQEGARKFCLGIASKLGHKRLVKGKWKDSYEVTLHHYVRPDLVGKLGKLV